MVPVVKKKNCDSREAQFEQEVMQRGKRKAIWWEMTQKEDIVPQAGRVVLVICTVDIRHEDVVTSRRSDDWETGT